MYLTYGEYRRKGGTLDEITFERFEFQAEAEINRLTFSRLRGETSVPREVQLLTHYLVDLMHKKALAFSLGKESATVDAPITSQSNDGVSISYNGLAPSDLIELCKTDIPNAIKSYLDGVTNSAGQKLLYRGLYPGE
jgi:hypothetical protein